MMIDDDDGDDDSYSVLTACYFRLHCVAKNTPFYYDDSVVKF